MSELLTAKRSSQSVLKRAVKNVTNREKNFIKLTTDENKDKEKPQVYKEQDVKTKVFEHYDEELRGVVYLSHIPPGFFETEMRQYFNQFGHVTRLKLARSEKTGQSKGYAFIEFRYSEVAKVVAETMNNYLMCNRLLKAKYLDNKFSKGFWNRKISPYLCNKAVNRRHNISSKNSLKSPLKSLQHVKKGNKKLKRLLSKLKAHGLDYDFKPSDVPNTNHTPVLEIDESDEEIDFQTPPNVIKRILKRQGPPTKPDTPQVKKRKDNSLKVSITKLPVSIKESSSKANAKLQITVTKKTSKLLPLKAEMKKAKDSQLNDATKVMKVKRLQSPSKDSTIIKKAKTLKLSLKNAIKVKNGEDVKVKKLRSVPVMNASEVQKNKCGRSSSNSLKVNKNVQPSNIPKQLKKSKSGISPSKMSPKTSPKKKNLQLKKSSPKKNSGANFKFSVGAHAKNAKQSSKKGEIMLKSPKLKKDSSLKLKIVGKSRKTFLKPKGKVVVGSKVVKKSSPSTTAVKNKKTRPSNSFLK